MPGPILTGVALPTFAPLQDLADAVRQRRHAIFNAQGRWVGSYVTLDALCAGHWLPFKGETVPPFSQLYVTDFWGKMLPASAQCVRAARATASGGPLAKIVQPQPVTPASAAAAVASNAATRPALPAAAQFDIFQLMNPDWLDTPPSGGGAGNVQLPTYAIWGLAAVIVGAALLAPGGGRRR
jgi:hypothetical protein